jgi:hypothetical protein
VQRGGGGRGADGNAQVDVAQVAGASELQLVGLDPLLLAPSMKVADLPHRVGLDRLGPAVRLAHAAVTGAWIWLAHQA